MDTTVKTLLLLNCLRSANARHWREWRIAGTPVEEIVTEGAEQGVRELGCSETAAARLTRLLQSGWAEEEYAACCRSDVELVHVESPTYPDSLWDLPDPPLLLYLRGTLASGAGAAAVVGTRRTTAYGRHVAREIGQALARRGCAVVSGGAAGVDGAAHGGTVNQGGRTVAVFGNGVDRVFPSRHEELFARILEVGGGLVSEYPLGMSGQGWMFPKRNRLIAALAGRVVIVEAPRKSGAMITARLGADIGREIWAVPGRIDEEVCRGSNRLIGDGALPLTDIAAFADLYAPRQRHLFPPDEPPGDTYTDGTASEEEHAVLGFVRERGDQTVDTIAAVSRMSAAEVTRLVTILEGKGLVYRSGPGRWRARFFSS
ncbi:MAG: DNA-processing protein DprA [Synergistales bacterium]|nr:DNA-processing protein DprA [Synergistales bacterium]